MWQMVLLLLVIGAIACVCLMNASPARCPLSRRINIWRRRRTGRKQDEHDQDGILLRSAAEVVCTRCQGRYWIVWDDFAGCQAKVPSGADADEGGQSD